ncbi:MAG TPA: hypothetical protein VJB89_00105 [Candidatus Nanoarchaeia archaeon]|nr:hypothetical protein [Candidatus Nanoarchaeia archaeon]
MGPTYLYHQLVDRLNIGDELKRILEESPPPENTCIITVELSGFSEYDQFNIFLQYFGRDWKNFGKHGMGAKFHL